MRMSWPLPEHGLDNNQHQLPLPAAAPAAPATLAASEVQRSDSVLQRVAALISPCFNQQKANGAGRDALGLAELAETGLLQIDTFATRFDGPDAASSVAAAFAQIAVQNRLQPYDAILVIGCGTVEPDVGMLHTVLAPCIAGAGIPVMTAVGSDDANTILGDVAKQVFADPAALIACVATRLSQVPILATEAIGRIRSLAAFLLTELTAASRIMLDASIRPTLAQRLTGHATRLEHWRLRAVEVKAHLDVRMAGETALLEDLRTYVEQQLTQRANQRRLQSRRALLRLRCLAALAYLSFVAVLWASATVQQVVFFGGCALVLLSAVYTTLSDRMLGDIDAVPVQADIERASRLAPTATESAAVLSSQRASSIASAVPSHEFAPAQFAGAHRSSPLRFSTGVPMNELSNKHLTVGPSVATDENLLLNALLQRLERSDHLSLDELDAIILQADAAYKARLARIERTRSMIARLGTPGETV